MQRDRYEGESMIIPGEEDTHGTTFEKFNNDVLGCYECYVDSSNIVKAWITDPVTFQDSWKNCYIMHVKTKRTYQTDWVKRTNFLPIEDWDVKAKVADWEFVDISLIEFEAEDPKPIKSTLVRPGVTVTVTDESIYVSQAMVDEWNYDQAMKIL